MTEKMTKKQAWYTVAEMLANPTHFFTGLCWELRGLRNNNDITYEQYCDMKEYCQSFIVEEEGWEFNRSFAYEPGTEREARILAALFFAEMA